MASTRDKRLKTDSPTPVVATSESITTPTTKSASTAIKLKRMSRNRSGLLSAKSENEDGNDSVGTNEDSQNATNTIEPPKTPNTRTKSKAREEEAEIDSKDDEDSTAMNEKDSQKSSDTPRTRKLTKAQMMKKKGADLALARRQALLKRKTLPPQPVKSSLRSISRRLSGGKTGDAKPEENQTKKPKKTGRGGSEKKDDEPEEKEEEIEVPEVETEIITEGDVEETESVNDVKIKEEKIDKNSSQASIDLQNVRRSTRQRKSTIKDRDSSFTRKSSQVRDKSEPKRDSISPALSNASSVKTEKDNSKAISISVEATETTAKSPSLSPELVSEEIDTESVQHLYDKPDFLENNLGIEQDPKLGEIVKVQEKTKVAEAIIKSDEANDDDEMKAVKTEKVMNGGVEEMIVESEIKSEEEDDEKSEESGEENKENNVASPAKSIDTGSPRSEDRLKSVHEDNVTKPEIDSDQWKQKESHLFSLGLLTHKAADEAKAAKQKRKEELAKTITQQTSQGGRKSKKDTGDQQYTGTLKIKLKRTEKNKREPLKMTFQKKNRDRDANGTTNSESFYTIQDKEASSSSSSSENTGAISRKSLNRSYNYNHDQVAPSNEQNVSSHEPVINKELEKSLVIPEKASSFKVHPERLCKDQCFYCGGRFGLYDTPCHIAQIKSTERQQKILDGEEKLTKDSCLCDACFRHVDRRANCPSYKAKTNKRLSAPSSLQNNGSSSSSHPSGDRSFGMCNVIGCDETAVHSIRRKWFVKMKKTISKIFNVDLDTHSESANVSICEEHFSALSHIMICAMCRRKLPRNHIFYINQDISKLESLIAQQGLNIKLANSTLVVCKLCSYFNNLLFKPPEPKTQKEDFVRNYSKKLMKTNNGNENLTLTIRNGKIQPKKPHDIGTEVTITPAPSASILLDNDVSVGYDVPFGLDNCPSPPVHTIRNPNYKGSHNNKNKNRNRRDDNNEMARVLKSNPNISMRELFPGEEEMNLNVNLPFNTSTAQRTADGWFKAQMTVQYDEVTKALWDRLQQPYGNPSSFLRHLILLEKYFRNGDLVLSPSASSSASTYSASVRNRLQSYDNISSNSSPVPGTSFSNEITITPTPKPKKINDSLTITAHTVKRKNSDSVDQNSPKQKQSRVEEPAPKKSQPPELISFNQQNQQRPVRETRKAAEKSETKAKENEVSITPTTKDNVIVLPSSLTPEDRKLCSKTWKPTLLPIVSGNTTITSNGQMYQTADGRKLPALVQVMSGGKPYHISIHDYNRMCILRREKLMNQNRQQAQQNDTTTNGNNVVNSLPNNNALSIIPMPKEKDSFKSPVASKSPNSKSNKVTQNIPNQILEQNSLIPINSSESNGKRHQNGASAPPPLTPVKHSMSLLNNMNMNIPSALVELSKSVNAVQPNPHHLQAWKELFSQSEFSGDNMAALAQFANLATMNSLGGGMLMDAALLSKIPKTLTVIPQSKSDRRSSDEQMKQNSASI